MVTRNILALIVLLSFSPVRAQGPIAADSIYLVNYNWPLNAHYMVWTLPTLTGNCTYAWPDGNGSGAGFLENNGSGALSWYAFSNLDSRYILNGTSLQSPANFNISGDGNLGGALNVAGGIQSNTLTAGVASGFGFIGTNNSGVIGIQTGGVATIPMSDGVANYDMENITPGTGITIVNATGPPSITISMNGGDSTGQNSYVINNPLHWPQTAKAGITGSFSCGGNDTIAGTLTQGISNTANSGVSSVVLGDSSLATNTASFAQGTASHATGWDAVAMGSSDATGTNDCALVNAIASGGYSFAAGAGAEASGSASFAIGNSVGANGTHSVALGENANCDFMSHSFVYGDGSVSTQNDAANQFMVRASGGYKLFTSSGSSTDLTVSNSSSLTTMGLGTIGVIAGLIQFGSVSPAANGVSLTAVNNPSVARSDTLHDGSGRVALVNTNAPYAWADVSIGAFPPGTVTVNASYNVTSVACGAAGVSTVTIGTQYPYVATGAIATVQQGGVGNPLIINPSSVGHNQINVYTLAGALDGNAYHYTVAFYGK